jgi:hypothetical protein
MCIGIHAVVLRNGSVVKDANRCLKHASVDVTEASVHVREASVHASKASVHCIEACLDTVEPIVDSGKCVLHLSGHAENLIVLGDCRNVAHEGETGAESDCGCCYGREVGLGA